MNVSIARELRLKPLAKSVLRHLRNRGSISPMEALAAYGTLRLSAVIHDLRCAGYEITTEMHRDEVGHSYARYVMRRENTP